MTRRPSLTATPLRAKAPRARAPGVGLALLVLCLAGGFSPSLATETVGKTVQPAAAVAATAPTPDPQSPARVNTRGEPQVLQRVLEDEHIVIEELVVRGQPVRISVRGKTPGARGYEINVGPGGRDASQDSGRAGQSAWRLFSF